MSFSTISRTRSGKSAAAAHELILRTSNLQDPELIEVYSGLSNGDVEQHLKTIAIAAATGTDSEISVWDYIHKQHGRSIAEAVQQVLVQQVEAAENTGYDVGVIMHYAHTHQVWKTHPDPKLRSSVAWMGALEMNRSLATTMLTGALGENRKQKYLISIARNWGHDWYNVLDKNARPAKVSANKLGQKELQCLDSIASSGTTLDEASRKFQSTIAARLARTNRKLKDHRNFLVRQDLESLMPWRHELEAKGKIIKLKSSKYGRQQKNVDQEHAESADGEQQSSDGDPGDESMGVVVKQKFGERESAQPRPQSCQSDGDDQASVNPRQNDSEGQASSTEGEIEAEEPNDHSNDAELPRVSRSTKRARTGSSTPSANQQSMEACCRQIDESMARLKNIMQEEGYTRPSEGEDMPACLSALCDTARKILGEFAADTQDVSRKR